VSVQKAISDCYPHMSFGDLWKRSAIPNNEEAALTLF